MILWYFMILFHYLIDINMLIWFRLNFVILYLIFGFICILKWRQLAGIESQQHSTTLPFGPQAKQAQTNKVSLQLKHWCSNTNFRILDRCFGTVFLKYHSCCALCWQRLMVSCLLGSPTSTTPMDASIWITFGGAPAKNTGFILRQRGWKPVGHLNHGPKA